MAHAFMLDGDDPFVMLSDIRSYNLYYGWYLGQLQDNDAWFDEFHKMHPDAAIGLSEFGADANPAYQSPDPEQGDWTESYQAIYHEHMLKMWKERPYIWAMHAAQEIPCRSAGWISPILTTVHREGKSSTGLTSPKNLEKMGITLF